MILVKAVTITHPISSCFSRVTENQTKPIEGEGTRERDGEEWRAGKARPPARPHVRPPVRPPAWYNIYTYDI